MTSLALLAERLSPPAPGKRPEAAVRAGVETRMAEIDDTLALVRAGLDSLIGFTRGMPDEPRHKLGNALTTTLYALGMVEQQVAALAKRRRPGWSS